MAWAKTPLASAANCDDARNDRPTMVAAGALPSSLIMSQTMSVGLQLAAGEHHADRVDERHARAIDDDWRCVLEIEVDDEFGDGLSRLDRGRAAADPAVPDCCARAAGGHGASPPPTRPINSLRLMSASRVRAAIVSGRTGIPKVSECSRTFTGNIAPACAGALIRSVRPHVNS